MIEITCRCGAGMEQSESSLNAAEPCAACGAWTTYVCGETLPPGSGAADFDVALVVVGGPARVGEQFALGGVATIALGKADERLIRLLGTQVSRHHATLVRVDFGPSQWEIHDNRSTNGLFVNGTRVAEHKLAIGDRIVIGDFTLEVRDASPASIATPVTAGAATAGAATGGELLDIVDEPPVPPRPSIRARPVAPAVEPAGPTTKCCPRCKKAWPAKAKFCTGCGTDLSTGKREVLSKEIDENQLYITAETVLRPLSIIMRFGIMPIASVAFGGKRPTATWAIAGVTALCSVAFMLAVSGAERIGDIRPAMLNLMLWSGQRPAEVPVAAPVAPPPLTDYEREQIRYQLHQVNPRADVNQAFRRIEAQRIQQANDAAADALEAAHDRAIPPDVGFRWYQLVTHAFLHDFSGWIGLTFHFGGNMVFLLVFGLRVNELIGQWRFVVSYVAVAIGAGLVYHAMSDEGQLVPMVGASGAIMGLAGMYLVLFPRQSVYMAIWLRLFGLHWKIWQMPGLWLLVAWVAWNDVLPVALQHALHLHPTGGVAHWAHLGGFVCGVALALVWLLTRQVHAHGHDLISGLLGPKAAGLVRQG